MKRKTVLCLLAALGLAALLADAEGVRRGVAEALALCGGTVIPSQFLFLAASSLLVSLGVGEVLAPRLEFLMWPLFRVDGAGAAALILGLVGGYPIGARTAAVRPARSGAHVPRARAGQTGRRRRRCSTRMVLQGQRALPGAAGACLAGAGVLAGRRRRR